ncbi:hypothetical protein B0T16DRAFT_139288 [Cercophora newfieldiana]|uniref:Prolyl 4-hydroxylase alpha subunit domain-containing protein n=1 Tax=Cercophora newfieldiana TaxID=92897 RepID=A0AA39YCB1_9PEZI|nr:hypothetical protein B0T16DRAFT_139288 [Cercophora newfieldiana]
MPRKKNADEVLQDGDIIRVDYKSRAVAVPDDFLIATPPDARPIIAREIAWRDTDLPEYEGRFATVLDHVLSPSECDALVRMAEDSVANRGKSGTRTWSPALVNIGGGREMLDKEYRNSDRIVWDNQEVMNRLWARCTAAEGLRGRLAEVVEQPTLRMRMRGMQEGNKWVFERLNERMRFLKYGPGQFFRPHCDGAFSQEVDGAILKTFYTLHLYLNNSTATEASAGPEGLVGGATSFLSDDHERRVDVNPKAGRVLIFEHEGLYHSGDDVVQGVKLTMRGDALFRLVRE